MSKQIKTIVSSLIISLLLVSINGMIRFFFVDESFTIFTVRSLLLFIIVFVGCITTIGESTEKNV